MRSAPRSANRIIATAVGLMVLVCTVVGVLGWRLLSQEETLAEQQVRDRLQRTAEQMTSKFTDRTQQLDAWLGATLHSRPEARPRWEAQSSSGSRTLASMSAPLRASALLPDDRGRTRASRRRASQLEALLDDARALAKQGDVDGALSKYDNLYSPARRRGSALARERDDGRTDGTARTKRPEPFRCTSHPRAMPVCSSRLA